MSGRSPLTDIETLVTEFQASGLRELHVRTEQFELRLSHDASPQQSVPSAQPAASVQRGTAPASSAAPAATGSNAGTSVSGAPVARPLPADLPANAVLVKAPYMGTFYRSPKPGAPTFVDVGATVAADTELCLVEVMKLFTAVRAGTPGRVHAVLAKDGEMVQADQPLFSIVPA